MATATAVIGLELFGDAKTLIRTLPLLEPKPIATDIGALRVEAS